MGIGAIIVNKIFEPESIRIKSFHISSESDKFVVDKNGIGIVLYSYDNKTEWVLNGKKCKAGYIVYKYVESLPKTTNYPRKRAHNKCYESVFGYNPEEKKKIFGGGFAYDPENGIKERSGTFNATNNEYRNSKREMNSLEFKWIKKAMDNWSKGIRNTFVKCDKNELCVE